VSGHLCIKCSCDLVGQRGDLVRVASWRRQGLGRAGNMFAAGGGPRARQRSSGVPTVGALTCGPAWLSGGAPDKSYRLSGVPPARALLLCARRRAFNALQSTVGREVAIAPLAHRTVRCAPDMFGEF
jgi:hypothetical protein